VTDFAYEWTTAVPAAGQVSMDQPWALFATTLRLAEITTDAVAFPFEQLMAGMALTLTTAAGTFEAVVGAGAVVDQGVYRDVPIDPSSSGGGVPADGDPLTLTAPITVPIPPPVVSRPRQAILDALAKVDGLNPTPTTPAPIVAGSAWPGWSSSTWINACTIRTEWFVFVALPNGLHAATVDAGDELVEDIATVLWPVGKVTRVEPWQWPVEPGQQAVPVLRYTLEV
jgi:hypothetical protein